MARSIEVNVEPIEQGSEVGCHNCQGVCCSGLILFDLDNEDLAFMKRGGSQMHTVVKPKKVDQPNAHYPIDHIGDRERNTLVPILDPERPTEPLAAGVGRYLLMGRCGYLVTTEDGRERCSTYDNKPKPCNDFEEGGDKCKFMRQSAGVDPMTELVKRRIEYIKMLREMAYPKVNPYAQKLKPKPKQSKRYTLPKSKT